ncbi:MAG: hypothetical protein JJ957_07945 [Pseudomonadales bacterium]|nr:hypothetical protein [Pseudomonadales bacterium]MBO6595760.1 hypothetical protein [Pseudomonadales bacterium]MBO6820682.1 hypothetical protein [Pseudomonadales bacterium]
MEVILLLLAFALLFGVFGGVMAVLVIPKIRRENHDLQQTLDRQSHRLDDLQREVEV